MKRRKKRSRRSTPGPGAPTLHASVAQLRALAHPLRLRVLELFAEEPRTTMQVATLLAQPPTRLYHHVNALERAGLLRLCSTRPKRGTTEKLYQTVAQWLTPAPAAGTRRGPSPRGRAHAVTGLGLLVLEQARNELAAALTDAKGPRPLVGRLVAAGSAEHVAAIRKRVREFVEELRRDLPSQVPARGGALPADCPLERWSLTLVFAPTWPRSKGVPKPEGG